MQQSAVHSHASPDRAGWQGELQLAGLVVGVSKAQVAQPFLGHYDETIFWWQTYEQVAFLWYVALPAEIPHQARSHPGGFTLSRFL
jgi:hypothetical protein